MIILHFLATIRTSRNGYVVNRWAQKLQLVGDSVVVGRSGAAADTQHLVEELHLDLEELGKDANGLESRVLTIATLLSQQSFNQKDSISASLLCAGWDSHAGLQIYVIPRGGALVPSSSFALSGSGSAYVQGYCREVWRADLSKDECVEVVSRALGLAMEHDGASGGIKAICVVEPERRAYAIATPGPS